MPDRKSLNDKETVLYAFDKSAKEQVRLSETIYLGRPYLDFRVFARKQDGEYIPTKKGITLSRDLFALIKQALDKIN